MRLTIFAGSPHRHKYACAHFDLPDRDVFLRPLIVCLALACRRALVMRETRDRPRGRAAMVILVAAFSANSRDGETELENRAENPSASIKARASTIINPSTLRTSHGIDSPSSPTIVTGIAAPETSLCESNGWGARTNWRKPFPVKSCTWIAASLRVELRVTDDVDQGRILAPCIAHQRCWLLDLPI